MTQKIFRSTLTVAAVVLLCSLTMILGVLYGYFDDVQIQQLRDELRITAVGTEQAGTEFLEALEAVDYRVTWIAPDGQVRYDTSADAASMENHAQREEFLEALHTGSGSAARQSQTLLERTVYEAVRLSDGSVLRISRTAQTMLVLVMGMLHPVILVAFIAIILSAILSSRMSRRIVEPLNALDLERPLENEIYEEISPLLRRINQQHLQIAAQMQALEQKANEFQQITDHMREGLVLLDHEGTILSINPAAEKIFGAGSSCAGMSFLALDRSPEMRQLLNDALDTGRGKVRLRRNGRDYRFDMSRIESDGQVIGAVMLAFDITETLNAERSRREFSANVSHELKTPLQSIMGSAELMENGLVRETDIPRFTGHIRKQAARLLNLIEDIIRLSQLDEGVPLPMEPVDLYALAGEAADNLRDAAQAQDVTLTVRGGSRTVQGVRPLLLEMVCNLCDNAIKYNVPGGSVTLSVTALEDKTVLTVSDTGIGIPAEHQGRVFERFYRVDKSHSRASGGTGLGLSIVKHAATLHKAKIDLESHPGTGTTITVTF